MLQYFNVETNTARFNTEFLVKLLYLDFNEKQELHQFHNTCLLNFNLGLLVKRQTVKHQHNLAITTFLSNGKSYDSDHFVLLEFGIYFNLPLLE